MKTKRTLLYGVLGVVVVWGSVDWMASRPAVVAVDPSVLTAEVRQGPMVITVKGTGDIRATESHKIIPKIRRASILEYIVAEGTRVTNEAVVARFNTDDIDRRVSELDTRLADTKSKLFTVQTDLDIQVMDNATAWKKAEQDLIAAEIEMEKFDEGDEPMDIRTADLKIRTAAGEWERKQRRAEELRALLKEGFVTADEVEEARLAMDAAGVALETANKEMSLLIEYTHQLKRATLAGARAKAQSEMEKVRKQNEARLQARQQAVESARWSVDQIEAELKNIQKERVAFEVRAPADGIIIYGDADTSSRRDLQEGTTVYPGQVLLTIPDMSSMQAVISIPEADIDRVHVGQPVVVKVEAVPDRAYQGVVSNVAEVANAGTWWSSDVKEFKVKLAIKDDTFLRPGFSCQAEIVTDSIPSTLYVPVQGVFLENKRYFVYTPSPVGAVKTYVTVGRASTTHVEIIKGVRSGDRLYLIPPGDVVPAATLSAPVGAS